MCGRCALATGGTWGIGAAIALDLAKRGYKRALCERQQDQETKRLLEGLEQLTEVCLIERDMNRPEDCAAFVKEAGVRVGRSDIVVHSAGGPSKALFLIWKKRPGWRRFKSTSTW